MDEFALALALFAFTIGVCLFQFEGFFEKIIKKYFDVSGSGWATCKFYFQRLKGFIYLGILPGIIMGSSTSSHFEFYGLLSWGNQTAWSMVLVLILFILLINYFHASKESNLKIYPQIRNHEWSINLVLKSAITWIIYLIAYEFVFRGILLFTSIQKLETITTIALNVCISVLFHFTKGPKESLMSIPFGFVLCLITIESGSLWPAIVIHVTLALSNEWFSIHFHPDMKFKSTL